MKMGKIIVGGEFENNKEKVVFRLLLISFKDENNVHFVYSPHLDLTGYGNSEEDAKSSFEIVLEDFIDYTSKKKTLHKVLTTLGWKVKSKKAYMPEIKINKQTSEIINKYNTHTFHKEVGIPVYA